MTERQKAIFLLIKQDPKISKESIAEQIEISISTVKRELKEIPVHYEGDSMTGQWIIDTDEKKEQRSNKERRKERKK